MKFALPESITLYNSIFSNGQKKAIKQILNEIYKNIDVGIYSTKLLWETDKEIGGIGGYCMPCDPIKNHFPGGEYRKLFRPLQYARSDIDMAGVYLNSRYIVSNCGMHLEASVRLILKKYKFLGNLRFMNCTLGTATNKISSIKDIPNDLIVNLFHFVKIYNKSKHEVNEDDNRKRLFMPDDAIIAYLASRIIGVKLLEFLRHDSIKFEYKIDESKFEGLFSL